MRQNQSALLVKFELVFRKVSGNVQTPLDVGVKKRCASIQDGAKTA